MEESADLLEFKYVQTTLGITTQNWYQGRGRRQSLFAFYLASWFLQWFSDNVNVWERYRKPQGHCGIACI